MLAATSGSSVAIAPTSAAHRRQMLALQARRRVDHLTGGRPRQR